MTIDELRTLRGLSMTKLCDAAGLSMGAIFRLTRPGADITGARLETLMKLAAGLDAVITIDPDKTEGGKPMKITFMTLQKASIVCLGVGMFLALGSAGTFETTGEIQTGVYVAAFVFLLAAGLLMRLSFALQDYEEKQRKIHKAQRGTVKKPSTKRKAG